MANTFVALATVTVGSGGASSVTFSNIPQTYSDLVVKHSARMDSSSADGYTVLAINGNTSTNNVTNRYVLGNGANASSINNTVFASAGFCSANNATASTFGNGEYYIPNYTGSTSKSISSDSVGENNGTTAYAGLIASLSSPTSAITSITLSGGNNSTGATANFMQYSSFTLYGIKNS